jgi:hypothetical protein
MSSDRTPENRVDVTNDHSKLWSMPWHARLKNLADTVGPESAEHVVAALRVSSAKSAVSVQESWLGRAVSSRIRPLM